MRIGLFDDGLAHLNRLDAFRWCAERRITSVVQYRDIFSIRRVQGDLTLDEGETLPSDYWYAEGRDYVMERQFARALRRSCGEG